jgi:hypothetical protein
MGLMDGSGNNFETNQIGAGVNQRERTVKNAKVLHSEDSFPDPFRLFRWKKLDEDLGAKAVDLILKVGNTHAMKSLSKAILALAAASLTGLACAAEQPEAVIHIGREKVDATFARGGLLLQITTSW